ncbi:MAG: outer membrane lipoprotein-sorting protein [Deltaproteobacteria bacterium]|nr:MAG: outer membrane lipoprotein-sorting protein [Deltaproteobacteria bacterium]
MSRRTLSVPATVLRATSTAGGWLLRATAALTLLLCTGAGGGAATGGDPQATLSKEELVALLREIDRRQSNTGDYKAVAFIEQKERGKSDLLYEVAIYRRDADDKLLILFLKPKTEAGKGYLRIENNLFFYDPTVGKWERRTERERIGGTGSQRNDFDEPRLAEDFEPELIGVEPLGKFSTWHLKLRAKEGADVPYPVVELWIDRKTKNVLKQQERALSGRLMRTSYYPKWGRIYSESKGSYVYFPKEIRIYDEVEKGKQTRIVMRKVDLAPLDPNIFTKAWLESKSR